MNDGKKAELPVTEQELDDVNTALANKEIYRKKLKYWENSDLMQLDPYHIQQAKLIFSVQAENMGQRN